MSKLAPVITLANGFTMPQIALGTWQARGREVYNAVKAAIEIGYRHIDTAYLYGNEAEVGQAVREKISDGTIRREDIFVTTKLWPSDFDRVKEACKRSFDSLNLGYIDLYLIHWPMPFSSAEATKNDYLAAYRGLEECVKLGLTRSIGVSNFNSQQIDRVLAMAEIKPVVNQVECSIMLNQKRLIAFCKERSIVVSAYCPLGRPDPRRKKPKFLFSEELAILGQQYGKTSAQVALRYLVDIGAIPLPKSANPVRIKENFEIFDFQLRQEDVNLLEKFNSGDRVCDYGEGHRDYPFGIEF